MNGFKNDESIGMATLDKIVDRNPLIVKPNTPVQDAIELMSGVRNKKKSLDNANSASANLAVKKSSYVLIVEEGEVVGIFTETDVVKLIATRTDLSDKKISQFMSSNVIILKQYQERNVSIALTIMRDRKIRHLPVVGSWGQLIGIITYENIRLALTPGCLLKMRSVSDVMETNPVYSDDNLSLVEVANLMQDSGVSYVIIKEKSSTSESKSKSVSDSGLTIAIGIITERDLVKFKVLELDFQTTKAKDVMSQPLSPVNPEDSLWQAHRIMLDMGVRRLVVTNKTGELIGILNQGNILQVFDPLEMSRVVTVLRQQVETRTQELEQNNQKLQQAYEQLKQQEQENKLTLKSQENFQSYIDNLLQEFNKINTEILETVRVLNFKYPSADREIKLLLKGLECNSDRSMELVEQVVSLISQPKVKIEKKKKANTSSFS
ncbi:MAG: CBS domain-containing protein [Prochloraceae cyanobacterium]|nr:CBS domain-containing protein [Prochloraceae cyanobacterium]